MQAAQVKKINHCLFLSIFVYYNQKRKVKIVFTLSAMIGLGSGYGRLARTIGWRSTAKPSHPWKPSYLVISSETISGEPSLSHGVTELGH